MNFNQQQMNYFLSTQCGIFTEEDIKRKFNKTAALKGPVNIVAYYRTSNINDNTNSYYLQEKLYNEFPSLYLLIADNVFMHITDINKAQVYTLSKMLDYLEHYSTLESDMQSELLAWYAQATAQDQLFSLKNCVLAFSAYYEERVGSIGYDFLSDLIFDKAIAWLNT
jgi:hypothetical protein